ncbi:MAG: hypothetical protein JKY74_07450 [Shewanella sp.]|nr:hypothetical protein [Shewanella sp.]
MAASADGFACSTGFALLDKENDNIRSVQLLTLASWRRLSFISATSSQR